MRALRSSLRLASMTSLVVAGLATTGCVSTQDIEGINSQLADIQRQVLQMQRQAPSKQDVENLDAQVGRQMESLLKTEADMQVKLQGLSGQIDQLQAKLEDTNYRLSQLSQQIAATNQELKSFRAEQQARPQAPADPYGAGAAPGLQPPTGAAVAPPQVPGAGSGSDPKSLYDSSYNDYLKGNYDLAMRGFQQYLADFPNTDLADNATYWIGESFYRQRRFRQAIEQFDAVLGRYPKSDKAGSALLKKGYAYLELGDRNQGVGQLRAVLRQFPNGDEANLARQRLKELGIDAK